MSIKEEFNKRKHLYLGILFLVLQVGIIIRNYFDHFVNFFWLCDFTAVIIAIGFFSGNTKLVRGVLNILLIPQILYILAFSTKQFVLPHLNTIPSFIANLYHLGFVVRPAWFIASALLLHLTGIAALFFTMRQPYDKTSLKYSLGLLLLVYLAAVFFTNPVDNINLVFTFSPHWAIALLWIPATFLVVVLPTYYFQKWLARWFGKKR